MKKVFVMMIGTVMAAVLTACGGSTASSGQQEQQIAGGIQGTQREAAEAGSLDEQGLASGEDLSAEGGKPTEDQPVTAADNKENTMEPVRYDPMAEYRKEEKPVLDTERVLVEIEDYRADAQGLTVDLRIENRTKETCSYSINLITLNRCLVTKIDTKDGERDYVADAGEQLQTWFRIPSSEFDKYGLAAVDELTFRLYATSEDDSDGEDDAEENGSFDEEICVYPTGKTKEEIDSGYVMAEEECDFLEDNDEYIFGMLKDPDFKKEDSVGTAYFYAENNTDHLIYLVLSEIYANNIRIKTKVSYITGDQKKDSIMNAWFPVVLPAGAKCIQNLLTDEEIEDNATGAVSDLRFALGVGTEGEEIKYKDIEYHYDGTKTSGTSEVNSEKAEMQERDADIYTDEPVVLSNTDLYTLTATGYRKNKIGFTVDCEIENKADKAYEYDLYTHRPVINQMFFDIDSNHQISSNGSVKIEAGKTAPCELTILSSVLDQFDITVVDRLTFFIKGSSVDDQNAMSEAYNEREHNYKEKDEVIKATQVTVWPTGKTKEEIVGSVAADKEDCTAYVSTDSFALGILKKTNMDNPFGVLTAYIENRTDQELCLELDGIAVNGAQLKSNTSGDTYPKTEILVFPPGEKGFIQIISPDDLEKEGISESVTKLECTVYHKEFAGQKNELAYYSERISCDF